VRCSPLLLGLSLALSLWLPRAAGADCYSDCEDAYQAAVAECRQLHPEPDASGALEMCIEDAKADREDCTDRCPS
jgi:hypothetical protein